MDRSETFIRSVEELEPATLVIRNMVNELLVYCPTEGCLVTLQRQSLKSHLKDDCSFVQVVCPHKGCGHSVQRRLLNDHLAICPYRLVQCGMCLKDFLFISVCSLTTLFAKSFIALGPRLYTGDRILSEL